MKKRTNIALMTLSLSAVMLFAGCSSKNAEPSPLPVEPENSAAPETPDTTEKPEVSETKGQAAELVALLNKSEAELVDAMGEGTVAKDDAGNVMVCEYKMDLYGVSSNVAASFEEGEVRMIIAYAEQNEFDVWAAKLGEELGTPDSDSSGASAEEGADARELAWNLDDGVVLTIKDAYGSLSMEIFKVAE